MLKNEKSNEDSKTINDIDKLTFKIRTGSDTLNTVYRYYIEQRRIKIASQQHQQQTSLNSKIGYKSAL